MSRKKGISTISTEDLYREILQIKKETKHHKTLISSLLTRTMEIELKQANPEKEILCLKTELMALAANLDERLEKQSLLAARSKPFHFRQTTEQVMLRKKVALALRANVEERKQRDEESRDEVFQENMADLGHMLKILEDIGQTLNEPGLSAEFAKKIHSSLQSISSVLSEEATSQKS